MTTEQDVKRERRRQHTGPAAIAATIGCMLLAGAAHAQATSATAQAGAPQAAESPQAQAARLYQEGNHAFEQKRWADAEAAYLKAWALSPTFDVAANLGVVELGLGKARDAARYLAFSLRAAPPSAKPAQLERTRHFLEEAKKKVGMVRVQVSVEGAELWLDGARVEAEEAKHEIFADPGPHELVVRREGYREAKETFVAAPGSSQEMKITLLAAPVQPPSAKPAWAQHGNQGTLQGAPAETAPDTTTSVVPVIALGAASGVSLAVAIGTTIASNGASGDADDQRSAILQAGGQCAAPSGAFVDRCGELHDTGERADTLGNVARVALVTSGALAIGAVVYLLWPRAEARVVDSVRVVPVVGVDQARIGVVGAW